MRKTIPAQTVITCDLCGKSLTFEGELTKLSLTRKEPRSSEVTESIDLCGGCVAWLSGHLAARCGEHGINELEWQD